MKHDARPGARILRDAVVQAQPRRVRTSARPATGAMSPPPLASGAPATTPASAPPLASPVPDSDAMRGYDDGLIQGRQQGMADAQSAIQAAVSQARQQVEAAARTQREALEAEWGRRIDLLERAIEGVHGLMETGRRQLESEAIPLAWTALCRVLGEHAALAPCIEGAVRSALDEAAGSRIARVRLNDRDLQTLMADAAFATLRAEWPQVAWESDAAVGLGGCLVDAAGGMLDARLETQLDALRRLWSAGGDETGGARG